MKEDHVSPVAERRELIRPGATLGYRLDGPDGAPTVVLLHGATLDGHAWDAQVAALRARYRLVVPDLRGHGTSERTAGSPSTTPSPTSSPCSTSWGWTSVGVPVALVGLSLGGNIAQEVAYRDPGAAVRAGGRRLHLQHRGAAPAAAPLTFATLSTMALGGREQFLRQAAAATSPYEDVRHYVLETNEDRTPARCRDPGLAAQ